MYACTVPPNSSTTRLIRVTHSPTSAFTSSGLSRSPKPVEPTMSAKRAVTGRNSSPAAAALGSNVSDASVTVLLAGQVPDDSGRAAIDAREITAATARCAGAVNSRDHTRPSQRPVVDVGLDDSRLGHGSGDELR